MTECYLFSRVFQCASFHMHPVSRFWRLIQNDDQTHFTMFTLFSTTIAGEPLCAAATSNANRDQTFQQMRPKICQRGIIATPLGIARIVQLRQPEVYGLIASLDEALWYSICCGTRRRLCSCPRLDIRGGPQYMCLSLDKDSSMRVK